MHMGGACDVDHGLSADTATGLEIIPRRWMVEHAFGWMIRWQSLVCDDEMRLDVSAAMMLVAVGALLLRRVAHRS